MSANPDVNPVIDAIAGRKLPAAAHIGSIIAIVVGLVAFLFGVLAVDKSYAWGAFLVGLVYTIALAQGGVIFAVILTGSWGRWGRPVKRIGEAFGVFLPVAWVLMVVFLMFGMRVFPWHAETWAVGGQVALAPHSPEALASKELWLQPGFMSARLILGVGLLIVLNFIYIRASMRPDMMLAAQRLGDKTPDWWSRVIGGATDLNATLKADLHRQAWWVPLMGFAYAVIMSLIAFDLMMSLSPWWFSNMFGGFTFVSSFWLALSAIGLVAMVARDWLKLGDFVLPAVTHDIGKLMLAGCMFWAYTAYAQLLPIWYTDMPEETDFLLVRLYLPEWKWLAQVVGVSCFVAPFTILLSRGIKKMRWPFVGICALIMLGLFFERSLIILPSIWKESFPRPDLLFVSIGTWIGFLGLFTQVVGQVLARVPPLVVSDPYLETHPWDVHVHSLDAHQH